MSFLNPMLLCDFYKISHRAMYPPGTEYVYSTWTPRESRIEGVDHVVAFGFQAFLTKWIIDYFNENFFNADIDKIIDDYRRVIRLSLGIENPEINHILELHKTGYLPLLIRAVPEGTLIPIRVPMLTIQNTDPEFFWLTNYVESLLSCEIWQACTSATIAHRYKKLLTDYAIKTTGSDDCVAFQAHDFSLRGMSSLHSAVSSGMGHLLSFSGTDNIPAIQALEHYYSGESNLEMIGCSIPATEHSIQCTYQNDFYYISEMISSVHPSGLISVVCDGYDFWNVLDDVLPRLKDAIWAREGKVVIRPDSGDPILIVCGDPNGKLESERLGAIEVLWNLFGGHVNGFGYKVLDPHIGLIYGDAITYDRAKEILRRLEEKGFASSNIVFGVGSYTYQYNTRDTFGFAIKSTYCVIHGKEKFIYKTPKTGNGVKNSQRGMVAVIGNDILDYKLIDGLDLKSHSMISNLDQMRKIYEDGWIINYENYKTIRNRLKG